VTQHACNKIAVYQTHLFGQQRARVARAFARLLAVLTSTSDLLTSRDMRVCVFLRSGVIRHWDIGTDGRTDSAELPVERRRNDRWHNEPGLVYIARTGLNWPEPIDPATSNVNAETLLKIFISPE